MNDDDAPASWFVDARRRQAERLVVGARVRIRTQRSECDWNRGVLSHHPDYDGATATVTGHRSYDYHGHNVIVRLDVGETWAYAAEELESLNDATRPERAV